MFHTSHWDNEGCDGCSLFSVELILQLHELARCLDLVGHLLALGEQPLSLLEGHALWSSWSRVLLLLAEGRGNKYFKKLKS